MQNLPQTGDGPDQNSVEALYSRRLCIMAMSGRHEAVERHGRNAAHRCLNCGRKASDEARICNPEPLGESTA